MSESLTDAELAALIESWPLNKGAGAALRELRELRAHDHALRTWLDDKEQEEVDV